MRSRVLPLALLTILAFGSSTRSEPTARPFQYTLQVAAFPDRESTEAFAAQLIGAGLRPVWGLVKIPERGIWFRIYIGEFETSAQARTEGESLISRGILKEFLVKRASEIARLSRSRRTNPEEEYSMNYESRPTGSSASIEKSLNHPGQKYSIAHTVRDSSNLVELPVSARIIASLVPKVYEHHIPRPDPVRLAFDIIAGATDAGREVNRQPGGLWLSGDIEDALARMQWIIGDDNARLLSVDDDGRLKVDSTLLQQIIFAYSVDPSADTLLLADYIYSNEGLLLIVQMAQGPHRYLLHIGAKAPTLGPEISISGSVNLDNNFDSRINPYRRGEMKLSQERPPEGFDALVAINPVARWFNLRANRIVPVGHITFHELAEAYAKVALGLDYLEKGIRPGAHRVALDREKILYTQRPGSGIVLTSGSNRVLKSDQEIRQFYAETGGSSDQR